jgi:hypothetical protein
MSKISDNYLKRCTPLTIKIKTLLNYNNKKFRPLKNSENGDVTNELIFHYKQTGNILTCEYSGKKIKKGQLLGIVESDGTIKMNYHQITLDHKLKTGNCISKPKTLENGKLILEENWQWTNGNKSKGKSTLEEI